MSILRTNSLSITAWRLAALFALTLAALALLPAVALAQTPPGAPSAVTVTRADGALTATWPAVPNAVEYHITYTSDNGKSWTAAASPGDNYSQNSVTINNADNGKPYIVGVRAGNEYGWSDWRNSPPAGPFTPPPLTMPPGTPSAVSITRAGGALTASWSADTRATKYHITYSSNNGKTWTLAALNHASSSITFSVENGGTYIVGVRAGNDYGWSGWRNSPPSGPYYPPTPPPAVPSNLRAYGGVQSVTLAWDNPLDTSIYYYEYQYRKDSEAGFGAWTETPRDSGGITSYSVTGLTNGTKYHFKLRAVNSGGASNPTSSVSATPKDGVTVPDPQPGIQPPERPASITLTRAPGTLTADWPDVERATSYHITYSADGGASWTLAALKHTQSGITITGVSDASTYIVAVRGQNTSGYGNWRNSAPVGPPASSELTVTNISTTAATLNIADHSGAWYYKANTGPDNTCQGPVSGSSKNLTGLTAGTRYTYTAYSASGCNSANELAAETFSTPVSVSNLNENAVGGLSLYSDFPRLAQAFTTGLNSGGYTLKTVTVNLDSGSSRTLTITLHNAASNGNDPSGDALVTLASGIYASGEHTFTCTGSNSACDLGAGTTYVIQLAAGGVVEGYYGWQAISTTNETKVPDTNGWSIGNRSRFYRASDSTWNDETTGQTAALKVVAVPK